MMLFTYIESQKLPVAIFFSFSLVTHGSGWHWVVDTSQDEETHQYHSLHAMTTSCTTASDTRPTIDE